MSVVKILAVIQVCLEGSLSKKHTRNSLAHGKRDAGDMIPWTIAQHFLVYFMIHYSSLVVIAS